MSEYVCTDCGHAFEEHNSFLVPFGCSVVDGTSVDCVNGYQGDRPPPPPHQHRFVCSCGSEIPS